MMCKCVLSFCPCIGCSIGKRVH